MRPQHVFMQIKTEKPNWTKTQKEQAIESDDELVEETQVINRGLPTSHPPPPVPRHRRPHQQTLRLHLRTVVPANMELAYAVTATTGI